ncbi:hypothetical protein D3C80_121280 [compost metagenome]
MAGTIYLTDREMAAIRFLRGQVANELESAADAEFIREAEEWFADVDNIEQKFRTASVMKRARVIADQIIKS